MLLAEFGTGQVFWSMLWFFLFFIWIWMLIVVFGDIFRSPDLSGWGKALWTIFVIFLPYLGVFVYLIARGARCRSTRSRQPRPQDAAMREYVQNVAGQRRRRRGRRDRETRRRSAIRASSARPSSKQPRPRRWPDRRRQISSTSIGPATSVDVASGRPARCASISEAISSGAL